MSYHSLPFFIPTLTPKRSVCSLEFLPSVPILNLLPSGSCPFTLCCFAKGSNTCPLPGIISGILLHFHPVKIISLAPLAVLFSFGFHECLPQSRLLLALPIASASPNGTFTCPCRCAYCWVSSPHKIQTHSRHSNGLSDLPLFPGFLSYPNEQPILPSWHPWDGKPLVPHVFNTKELLNHNQAGQKLTCNKGRANRFTHFKKLHTQRKEKEMKTILPAFLSSHRQRYRNELEYLQD